jgi:chemotaxis response regulator CheB
MSTVNAEEPEKKRSVSRKPLATAKPIGDAVYPFRSDERPFIVGIGASAGGLEALSLLLPSLPKNLGLTYVVVQHLSPTYRSMMAQLLGRETTMPVRDIEDGMLPEANTVYITPPNRNLTLLGGSLPARRTHQGINAQAIGQPFLRLTGRGSRRIDDRHHPVRHRL